MEHLVIVGAGQSAIQCITSLRKEDYPGLITLVGEEEHLPYQRPPLSKGFLEDTVSNERLYFKKLEFFVENKVQLKLGTKAEEIDIENNNIHLSDNTKLSFDKLVFATGSSVRKLDFPGKDLNSIHYLRGLDDALSIKKDLQTRQNIVVVGAGYIGLEVAAIAAKQNKSVTVIEMADRVMNRTVDPQISDYYLKLHQKNGVTFKFNTSLKEIVGASNPEKVICSDGTEVKADMVIIGAGIMPNVELAENAGLSCDNGIVVNEFGKTDHANIYACGDCTNHPNKLLNKKIRLESVHNAMEQSKTVASSIINKSIEYNQIPWFWSDQYDHKLQIVGLSGEHDKVIMRGDMSDAKFMLLYTKDEKLIAVDAVNNSKEFLICKKLVANKVTIKADEISNPDTNLNDLIE
jgi:3-phenylpropionate/trans-cinnamate dioxygenase ferredoxin reductase subunit|tara:strand:- start:1520 stop:2734 length:1215 start_codon:yes stop_codon:yes gene_type:complete